MILVQFPWFWRRVVDLEYSDANDMPDPGSQAYQRRTSELAGDLIEALMVRWITRMECGKIITLCWWAACTKESIDLHGPVAQGFGSVLNNMGHGDNRDRQKQTPTEGGIDRFVVEDAINISWNEGYAFPSSRVGQQHPVFTEVPTT